MLRRARGEDVLSPARTTCNPGRMKDARRAGMRLGALLVVIAAAGCGSGGGGGSGGGSAAASTGAAGGTPLAIDDFCAKLADAYCDRRLACACPGSMKASCTGQLLQYCSDFILGPTARADIAAGTIDYDADAAGQLVAGVRARMSRGQFFPV